MHDPTVGRFLSQDPLGFDAEDPNLYRYVGNSSTNATDPSGLITDEALVGENEWRHKRNQQVADADRLVNKEFLLDASNDINAPCTGAKVAENAGLGAGQQAMLHAALRAAYHKMDAKLGETARRFVSQGMSVQEAAKWRVENTNALKDQIRSNGNPIVDILAKRRAARSGFPDMPSFEALLNKYRARGLTDDQACSVMINRMPNVKVDRVAIGLRIAGTTMLVIDIGVAGYRVYESPTWDAKVRTLLTEAARIGGATAGAWGGARAGASLGVRAGPWGGVIGGVAGGVGGGIAGGAAAEMAMHELVYRLFPPGDFAMVELLD